MQADDLALLDQWIGGDAEAGGELFARHFSTVYRFFDAKTEGDVDDLVQETFLACVKGRHSFRRQSTFRSYLLGIARHVLFRHWRNRRASGVPLDFEEISIASLSTSAGSKLALERDRIAVQAALRQLPLDTQLLLELFYWEELDRDSLAQVFEVESATIGTRLFRARGVLKERMAAAAAGSAADEAVERFLMSRR